MNSGVFRSFGKNLTAATDNEVYVVPPNVKYSYLRMVYLANSDVNNKKVQIKWFDASKNETYNFVNGYSLAANQFLKLEGANQFVFIQMQVGDKLIINPETGSVMSAVVTVEEVEQS